MGRTPPGCVSAKSASWQHRYFRIREVRIFHLERLKDRNVYELSSGERQFISILSAWAMDTDIFLLDEPTANLDFAATQQLKEILLALKRQGKTLLLSEHRLYYLADIADEFWVMADGEIKGKYTAAEAKAFSAERRQTLSLRTLDLAEITVSEKEPLPKTAPTVLAVSDVRYTYGRKAGDTVLLLITFAVACILSEAYRAITKYDNRFIHMVISFMLFCYGMLGSPLAIWVYKDSFLTQIQQNGMSAEYVESLSGLISVPMLIALCISPIAGGAIGALISKGLFRKHFRKAGIV